MKQILFFRNLSLFIIPLFLFSCAKENIEREVFMGMKPGWSSRKAEERIKQLVDQRIFDVYDYKLPHYVNTTTDHKNYYSAPLSFTYPGDTIVNKMKVVYCDNLEQLAETVRHGLNDMYYMNLRSIPKSYKGITAEEIWADITKNLLPKYGNFDDETTTPFENNLIRKRVWKNRDGINIELEYFENEENRGSSLIKNSRVYLLYTYVDEIDKQIQKNKSIY